MSYHCVVHLKPNLILYVNYTNTLKKKLVLKIEKNFLIELFNLTEIYMAKQQWKQTTILNIYTIYTTNDL